MLGPLDRGDRGSKLPFAGQQGLDLLEVVVGDEWFVRDCLGPDPVPMG